LRIATPFPLMNIVAREKGVTASIEGQALVLTVGPGDPPPTWPSRQLDLLGSAALCGRGEHVGGDSRFPAGRQATSSRTF
jgi:hypothetical protein